MAAFRRPIKQQTKRRSIMAIIIECPRCSHTQKIDDDKAGNEVPCKICHHLIKAPASKAPAKVKLVAKPDAKEEGIKPGTPVVTAAPTAVAAKKPKPTIDDEEPRHKRKRAGKDDDDDDDRRPRSRRRRDREESGGGGAMMAGLGIGAVVVVLLLCAGGGLAGLIFMGRVAPPVEEPIVGIAPINVNPDPGFMPGNPPPIIFPPGGGGPAFPPIEQPIFQPPEVLDPNDPKKIVRVLELLKGTPQDRGVAYKWLRAADPNHPRKSEVARQLDAFVDEEQRNQFAFAGDFFPAFFRWATKDNVAALKRMAENNAFNPSDNDRRQQSMLALGRLKEASAAENIASKLGNAFDGDTANKALIDMGPVAEPAVLKSFNHPDGRTRDVARALIIRYNTSAQAILTQCVSDLNANDNNRRSAAVHWLAGAPVDANRKSEVARALNKTIPTANFFFDKDLAKVLEKWGTADNVPTLIQRLEANQTGNDEVIRALGKIRDPNGIKAIAKSYSNFFNQGAARTALLEVGPALANPALVEAMNTTIDAKARVAYIKGLGEVGTRQTIPAITQIAARSPQDFFLQNEAKRAVFSINARGK
jgi:hypothetical protein